MNNLTTTVKPAPLSRKISNFWMSNKSRPCFRSWVKLTFSQLHRKHYHLNCIQSSFPAEARLCENSPENDRLRTNDKLSTRFLGAHCLRHPGLLWCVSQWNLLKIWPALTASDTEATPCTSMEFNLDTYTLLFELSYVVPSSSMGREGEKLFRGGCSSSCKISFGNKITVIRLPPRPSPPPHQTITASWAREIYLQRLMRK